MEKLVKRAQKGDKDAFLELVEQNKLALTRAAMAMLHHEEDTADAVSETVLTAFLKLYTLREPKYFKTWLTRILICNCYDILRKRKRQTPMEELPEQGVTDGYTPGRERDGILDIRRSLDSLAENDRLVLTLHYLDGFSVKDIAGMLEVKENTVKSRLLRGRERFRKAYEEREPGTDDNHTERAAVCGETDGN